MKWFTVADILYARSDVYHYRVKRGRFLKANFARSDKENFLIHGELTETYKALLFFSELGSNLNFRRFLLNR